MRHAARMIRSSARKPAVSVIRPLRIGVDWNSAARETGVPAIGSRLFEVEDGDAIHKLHRRFDINPCGNVAYGFAAPTAALSGLRIRTRRIVFNPIAAGAEQQRSFWRREPDPVPGFGREAAPMPLAGRRNEKELPVAKVGHFRFPCYRPCLSLLWAGSFPVIRFRQKCILCPVMLRNLYLRTVFSGTALDHSRSSSFAEGSGSARSRRSWPLPFCGIPA
jgi:hypothetical protein